MTSRYVDPQPLKKSRSHVLATRAPYHDLGADYFLNATTPEYPRGRPAIAQMERLGYQVNLEPRAA